MTSKEWKKCKLGDIADVTKLAGFEFTKYINYDESGEIIALRALNLRNGILDLSDIKRIKKSVSDSLTRSKLYINDILLTYTGNGYGDCAIIKENDKYHLAPNICKISPKIEIVDPYYLYSYIRSKQFYTQMTNNMVGSGQPTIPMKTIRILEIPISSKNKQQKIAKVLSAIDDKIELNNSINNNLEQQAQAIFNSWFVDFEPFGGTMPKNWKNGTIEDLSQNIICGKTPSTSKKEYYGNDIPFITIPDMHNNTYVTKTGRYLSRLGASSQKNKILPPNSICVSCIATAGLVSITAFYSQTNQQINSIIPAQEMSSYYIYLLLKSLSKKIIMLGSSGSTTCNLNKGQFAKIEVIIPDKNVLKKYDEIVSPLFESIKNNQLENEQLIQLRNTLLPKLMSSEIDVSEVDISTDKLLFSEDK